MDYIEISQNEDGSWYSYDCLNLVVIKDGFEYEKQAYDYSRFEWRPNTYSLI